MKTRNLLSFLLLTSMLVAANLVGGCKEDNSLQPLGDNEKVGPAVINDILDCTCIVNPSAEISDEEAEMLIFMREEEKLARDVYTTFSAQYTIPVFKNIAKSEQWHMDRVLCLLNYYNIEDPAQEEVGVFNNSELQKLYNNLVEQGSASLIDALTVGATIEDVDIRDLSELASQTENEAIITIFEHLKCGSTNHMRAFSRILNNNDVVYTPQFISQEEYDIILSGENGPCENGNANVKKDGKTYGKGTGTCINR